MLTRCAGILIFNLIIVHSEDNYPFLVQFVPKKHNKPPCIGSLIAPKFVLTVKECCKFKSIIAPNVNSDTTLKALKFCHNHPTHFATWSKRNGKVENNIAIYEVSEPVKNTAAAKIGGLDYSSLIGRAANTVGYNKHKIDPKGARKIHKNGLFRVTTVNADVLIMKCERFDDILHPKICTMFKKGNNDLLCRGGIGVPLVFSETNPNIIIGVGTIIPSNRYCVNKTGSEMDRYFEVGVYNPISIDLNWIVDVVSGAKMPPDVAPEREDGHDEPDSIEEVDEVEEAAKVEEKTKIPVVDEPKEETNAPKEETVTAPENVEETLRANGNKTGISPLKEFSSITVTNNAMREKTQDRVVFNNNNKTTINMKKTKTDNERSDYGDAYSDTDTDNVTSLQGISLKKNGTTIEKSNSTEWDSSKEDTIKIIPKNILKTNIMYPRTRVPVIEESYFEEDVSGVTSAVEEKSDKANEGKIKDKPATKYLSTQIIWKTQAANKISYPQTKSLQVNDYLTKSINNFSVITPMRAKDALDPTQQKNVRNNQVSNEYSFIGEMDKVFNEISSKKNAEPHSRQSKNIHRIQRTRFVKVTTDHPSSLNKKPIIGENDDPFDSEEERLDMFDDPSNWEQWKQRRSYTRTKLENNNKRRIIKDKPFKTNFKSNEHANVILTSRNIGTDNFTKSNKVIRDNEKSTVKIILVDIDGRNQNALDKGNNKNIDSRKLGNDKVGVGHVLVNKEKASVEENNYSQDDNGIDIEMENSEFFNNVDSTMDINDFSEDTEETYRNYSNNVDLWMVGDKPSPNVDKHLGTIGRSTKYSMQNSDE